MNFLCNLAVIFCAATPSGAPPHVIDGDGFELDGRTVRLWGIDAPELAQECQDRTGAPYPCGRIAKAALREIFAESAPICELVDRDRFGRDVSRCSVEGEDVGGMMVRSGWAVDFERYSGGAYLSDQADTRDDQRVLWSGTFMMPWDWRDLSK